MLTTAMLLLTGCIAGCNKKAVEAWSIGKPLSKDAVKIGIIYLDDAKGGYSSAHDNGLIEAQQKIGLKDDQIIRKFNIDETDYIMTEAAIREVIAEGVNIVIATSWGHMDACETLAAEHPDIVFAHASGYKRNDSNFTNFFGRIYQARYMSGIAAGLMTKSDKIGFVAAQDKSNSEVTSGLNAFALGVESVNPDAEIYVSTTYSWYDPRGERLAAERLLDEGCDVIAQHCDTEEPMRAAEKLGRWSIGYNINRIKLAPETELTSVIWNWGAYYAFLINSVMDGSFTPEPYFGGLAEGMVDITPLNPALISPEMEAAVAKARNDILVNGFNVFDGVMVTNSGDSIGTQGGTLTDAQITGGMNWYYRNIIELK